MTPATIATGAACTVIGVAVFVSARLERRRQRRRDRNAAAVLAETARIVNAAAAYRIIMHRSFWDRQQDYRGRP